MMFWEVTLRVDQVKRKVTEGNKAATAKERCIHSQWGAVNQGQV